MRQASITRLTRQANREAKMALTIKCHGEFYAREGQLKIMKTFEEAVRAPSLKFFEQTAVRYTGTDDDGKLKFSEKSFINVRGQLKKKLIPLILGRKYAGTFVRVRSVVIDEVVAEEGTALDLPITLMSFAQLAALMKQRNVPLDVSSYLNIDELRTDISEYLEDPDAFKRNFERKAKKRSEEREFMELNNLMPQASVKEPKAQKIEKKAPKVGIEALAQGRGQSGEASPF